VITTLRTMIRDEEGATMLEYGVLVALIAIVCLAAITAMGNNLERMFHRVSHTL
jgi:pilus assembly protein Flp/PilA